MANFVSATPWLVTLSRHKNWVFLVSGLLIGGNFAYTYLVAPRVRATGTACSPDTPEACETASAVSRVVLWISAILYSLGFLARICWGRCLCDSAQGSRKGAFAFAVELFA